MKKKYVILIASCICNLCLGIFYIWSVFQEHAVAYFNWSNAAASTVFYIMLVANVLGIIVAGHIYQKIGPRYSLLLSGTIFSLGLALASWAPKDAPWLLYIFYGAFGGYGVGSGYNSILMCIQKWWVAKRGLSIGIVVGSFGASTVIFTPIINSMIINTPLGITGTFRVLAIIFFVTIATASSFLENPPADYAESSGAVKAVADMERRQYVPREIIRLKQYYLILVCFICLPAAYYILNPLFKSLAEMRGLSTAFALLNVMVTGVASVAGRFIFARLTDTIGPRKVMNVLFILMFVASAVLSFARGYLFMVIVALVALSYGGCTAITPVLTSEFFGPKHVGANMGLVMIATAISGLGIPPIANLLSNDGMPTPFTFIVPAVCAVIGIIVNSINNPPDASPQK